MPDTHSLQKAREIAQELILTYEELESVPGNIGNRAIRNETKWVRRWLAMLDDTPTSDAIADIWREVQNSSRVMDGIWNPQHLSKRKSRLYGELFEAVLELVIQSR